MPLLIPVSLYSLLVRTPLCTTVLEAWILPLTFQSTFHDSLSPFTLKGGAVATFIKERLTGNHLFFSGIVCC